MLVQCEVLHSCVGSINDKRRVLCVKGLIDKDLIEVEVDFFPKRIESSELNSVPNEKD